MSENPDVESVDRSSQTPSPPSHMSRLKFTDEIIFKIFLKPFPCFFFPCRRWYVYHDYVVPPNLIQLTLSTDVVHVPHHGMQTMRFSECSRMIFDPQQRTQTLSRSRPALFVHHITTTACRGSVRRLHHVRPSPLLAGGHVTCPFVY